MKRLIELVTDAKTGRLSHTKLWPNVACLMATILFIRMGWKNQLTVDHWWAYLVCVGGYTTSMRLAQAMRERGGNDRT